MDQGRFDDMARGVASGLARRVVLRALIGLAAAAFPGRVGDAFAQSSCAEACPEGQVCQDGACVRPCANNRDCRSKRDDPCLSNTCIQGRCIEAIIDCLPGYECCKGECCAKSCDLDDECAVLEPCRRGACGPEKRCVFTQLDPCVLCTSDAECGDEQDSICCGGSCKRPCPQGSVMGKGCECRADESGITNGLVVRDDASGESGVRP